MAPCKRQSSRSAAADVLRRRSFGENNINAGRLRELPWISIDKFYGEHLKASVFILSHCHTDHMVGLDEDEFWTRLNEPGVKLLTHQITPLLIKLFERYLRGKEGIEHLLATQKLVTMATNVPVDIIEPSTGATVTLTLLSAGHCPGSVMFQFEYDDQCILHTGDCRVSKEDLIGMDSLHNLPHNSVGRRVKPVSHLYVDTTFCSSRSQHFPGRVDAVDRLIETVRSWFALSRHNCVNLLFAARFSHEYVLVECHKAFGIQYHVSQERYAAYSQIPELFEAVTTNPNTKFHLCEKNSPCLINCTNGGSRGRVLRIKLSSLWFMRNKNGQGPALALKHDKANDLLTMCYAMHSSLDEICDMISYLRPKVVTPLVLPKGMERKELELELRRNAMTNFVYEDYPRGIHSKTVLKVYEAPAISKPENKETIREETISETIQEETNRGRKRIRLNFRWTPSPSPPRS